MVGFQTSSCFQSCSNATYCQGCLACLTGYLVLLCFDTHYEKKQKEAKALLDAENEKRFRFVKKPILKLTSTRTCSHYHILGHKE